MTTSPIPSESSTRISMMWIGAVLAIAGALALAYAIGARQDLLQQAQITQAGAQENADFCVKLGFGKDTNAYASCVEGLSGLTRRHDERSRIRLGGIL